MITVHGLYNDTDYYITIMLPIPHIKILASSNWTAIKPGKSSVFTLIYSPGLAKMDAMSPRLILYFKLHKIFVLSGTGLSVIQIPLFL